jgi:threonylcarbamoyladenosine tRNA methylthiotransferase MtaB
MPIADVSGHLARLGYEAFREVVLTGIHLGAYGLDLDPPTTLTDLLTSIEYVSPVDRIRLSSIEPTEINNDLIRLVADSQTSLCRHFHIPLQSGDNGILSRMGRPYTREDYQRVVMDIVRDIPGVAIGADVLVGFPGEDDRAFDNTCALIEELPVTYLHVFPFSPRKGTQAALFKDNVPDNVIKQRAQRLRDLGKAKKEAFFQDNIGRQLKVLIESDMDQDTGFARGLSDNYIPVLVTNARLEVNDMVDVLITGQTGNALSGEYVYPNVA